MTSKSDRQRARKGCPFQAQDDSKWTKCHILPCAKKTRKPCNRVIKLKFPLFIVFSQWLRVQNHDPGFAKTGQERKTQHRSLGEDNLFSKSPPTCATSCFLRGIYFFVDFRKIWKFDFLSVSLYRIGSDDLEILNLNISPILKFLPEEVPRPHLRPQVEEPVWVLTNFWQQNVIKKVILFVIRNVIRNVIRKVVLFVTQKHGFFVIEMSYFLTLKNDTHVVIMLNTFLIVDRSSWTRSEVSRVAIILNTKWWSVDHLNTSKWTRGDHVNKGRWPDLGILKQTKGLAWRSIEGWLPIERVSKVAKGSL